LLERRLDSLSTAFFKILFNGEQPFEKSDTPLNYTYSSSDSSRHRIILKRYIVFGEAIDFTGEIDTDFNGEETVEPVEMQSFSD